MTTNNFARPLGDEERNQVPESVAMQPPPNRPSCVSLAAWESYFLDLACWKAMKADVYRYGIEAK